MNLINKFRIQTYNIGFITKPVKEIVMNGILSGDIVWVKHNYKDRFFADPFLWYRDKDHYFVLCEEMTFWEQKGVISLLKIRKDSCELVERKTVIEESTHLSFPFCEENGNYVIPESLKSGQCKKYIFNDNHELVRSEVIFDEGLIDSSFFMDKNGDEWMFTAKKTIPNKELFLYYKNAEGKYQPVKHNPVESNIRTTRSAGRFFYSNGKLYRPVQDCLGRYGKQTKILEMKSISKDGIEYEDVATLNSFANPPFSQTFHTFNVYNDVIVIDGSYDFFRFPMKIFYRKCKWMFGGRK